MHRRIEWITVYHSSKRREAKNKSNIICIKANIEPIFIVTSRLMHFFPSVFSSLPMFQCILLVARYLYNIPTAMQSRARLPALHIWHRHIKVWDIKQVFSSFFPLYTQNSNHTILSLCMRACVSVTCLNVRTMQQLFNFIHHHRGTNFHTAIEIQRLLR